MYLTIACSWLFRGTDNLGTLISTLISSIFVGAGLIFAAWQWGREQKRKHIDTLINRISAFNETPGALNALMLLDWPDRNIPLMATEKLEDSYVRVNRTEAAIALIPAKFLPLTFSPKETAIRDSFEDYLVKLSHLEPFIASKLLTEDEAKVIISNLLHSLKKLEEGNDIDKALLRHLYLYVADRDFYGLKSLLKRFQINIDKETKEAEVLLSTQIENKEWTRPILAHPTSP